MITLIFILICYGACNNIIYGSVFEGFRDFLAKFGTGGYSIHKLFTCFMCLGTWMGFAISAIMAYLGYIKLTPMGSIGMDNIPLIIFLNGLLSAGGVWLSHSLQEALERAFTK
jgi:PPE-repeat protein